LRLLAADEEAASTTGGLEEGISGLEWAVLEATEAESAGAPEANIEPPLLFFFLPDGDVNSGIDAVRELCCPGKSSTGGISVLDVFMVAVEEEAVACESAEDWL
jgi:hypothetical protein